MLSNKLFSFFKRQRPIVATLLLLLVWVPVLSADDTVHSHAPAFSDPAILAPVPENWTSKPVKHLAKFQGADLVIALGQQSYPVFNELIQEYAQSHNLKIVVEQGTCGITSGRLLKKKVDVGAFCCPPGKNDRFPGLKFYSLGISPIALLVHPDNPLQDVSTEQAKKIFDGQISRWSEIGSGTNQLVQAVGRLHCKTRPGHWRSLLKSGDEFSPRLFEVGVIPDMISQVARNTGSIGWETPLMVEFHKKKGDVKMLRIDGHLPTDIDNLLKGKYPLYRSYSLTAWTEKSETNERALKLIRYLRSHVENIYEDIGFIPVSKLRKAGWKFIGDELIGKPEVNK